MVGVLKSRTAPATWIPVGAAGITLSDVNAKFHVRTFTPGTDTNFDGTGAFTTSFTFNPTVNVPAWATTAFVQVTMSRVFLAGTVAVTDYEMRVGIGGQFSLPNTRLCLPTTAVITAALPTVVCSGLITLSGTGAQTMVFQTQRVAGTGTGRIDIVSDAVALIIFQPS